MCICYDYIRERHPVKIDVIFYWKISTFFSSYEFSFFSLLVTSSIASNPSSDSIANCASKLSLRKRDGRSANKYFFHIPICELSKIVKDKWNHHLRKVKFRNSFNDRRTCQKLASKRKFLASRFYDVTM